jgi:hypothetical protein
MMFCVLCRQHIDLWDLDGGSDLGMPAHEVCARAYRAELAAVLADAEAMILAEADPRRHRRHLRPTG